MDRPPSPSPPTGVVLAIVLSGLQVLGSAPALVFGVVALALSHDSGDASKRPGGTEGLLDFGLTLGAMVIAAVGAVLLVWSGIALLAALKARRGVAWTRPVLIAMFALQGAIKLAAAIKGWWGPALYGLPDLAVVVLLARERTHFRGSAYVGPD